MYTVQSTPHGSQHAARSSPPVRRLGQKRLFVASLIALLVGAILPSAAVLGAGPVLAVNPASSTPGQNRSSSHSNSAVATGELAVVSA